MESNRHLLLIVLGLGGNNVNKYAKEYSIEKRLLFGPKLEETLRLSFCRYSTFHKLLQVPNDGLEAKVHFVIHQILSVYHQHVAAFLFPNEVPKVALG